MSFRTVEVTTAPDALQIRHEGGSGPECRLRAALLFCNAPAGDAPDAALAGAAWEGPDGSVVWGWPDAEGQIRLRPGPDRPEVCSLLPTALALVLALRRSGTEPGVRALVIGDGFLSRMAGAVARTLGCRVRTLAGRVEQETRGDTRPEIVIETTGDLLNLEWATDRCRDWGTVYSLAGAQTSGPFDYYAHVHRRALTITQVPHRPVLRPGEEEVAERSAGCLSSVLRGISPTAEEVLVARVLPEGTTGRVVRERGGWGLLLVMG